MCKSKFLIDKFIQINEKIIEKNLKNVKNVEGITEYRDIPYVDDGNMYHLLDVVRPEGDERLPVIIDIHGGAWLCGTKEVNSWYCRSLAKYGFCVVNINYRLIAEGMGGTFPNILNDVFDAFKWVENNIGNYGGDINNVFLTGDSAGGHLACLSACINADEKLGEELNMKSGLNFRAVGLNCPAVNIDRYRKIKLPVISYLYKLFFGKEGKKHVYSRLVSLQNAPLDKLPPVFLITAYGDFMRYDVKFLHKELKKRDKESVYFCPEKKSENKLGHVYSVLNPELSESVAANEGMTKFFKSHVRGV